VRFRRAADAETSGPSWEVEIELRDGEESEISRLAAELRRDYPLEPTRLSKLERALRWAGLDR
jgi:inorganic triphosphatase YgiF